MKNNIVLIGPSGVGKTTVGSYLSKKLSLEFVDTDTLITNIEGRSIENIFKEKGESYFRQVEKKVIKNLSNKEGIVIATGGGIVLNPINIELLRNNGKLFLLYGSIEWITKNIKGSRNNRPLIKKYSSVKEGVSQLLKSRKDIYFKSSDYIIYVDNKSIEEIGNEIIHLLQFNCK